MWNYATLSKAAKESGGPEKLVEQIYKAGKNNMKPWLGVAAVAGSVVTILGQNIYSKAKEKKKKKEEELETAKAELIRGIKEYDMQQAEKNDVADSE